MVALDTARPATSPGPVRLARWVWLCATAETVGMTAAASAARLADTWFPAPRTGRDVAAALGLVVVGGLVEGTALGVAQASGLRGWLSDTGRRAWVAVTVLCAGLGWAAASAPAVLGTADGGTPPIAVVLSASAALGLAMGSVLGLVQAPLLRERVPHPWRWVGASAAGWTVAMPVIFLGASSPSASWPSVAVVALGAATGAIAGALLGVVTGRLLPLVGGRTASSRHPTTTAARDLRRAWWCLAFYPLALAAAFAVGEGLAQRLGYDTGSPTAAPVHVALLAGVPAMLLFAVPGVLASYFGRRAMRHGDPRGLAPLVAGTAIALGFAGSNVAAYLARLLLE